MSGRQRTRQAPGAAVAGLAGILLLSVGCAAPPPRPTPVFPTRVPTPSQNAAAVLGEDAGDIQAAFLTEVQGVVDQATYLAGGTCPALAALAAQDPRAFTRLREYAALLKRVASQDQTLAEYPVPDRIEAMDVALEALAKRLGACGVAG